MSVFEQLRKEWISEAKKRGLFKDDLISRQAVHDNIGELELFAYLTDDDIRKYGLHVDEDGEFYFTEEQGRMASVMYVLMRRYINGFPAVLHETTITKWAAEHSTSNTDDEVIVVDPDAPSENSVAYK